MLSNFGKAPLLILLLKNFGWMKRSIICMDGNSMRLLIFYRTEAITKELKPLQYDFLTDKHIIVCYI